MPNITTSFGQHMLISLKKPLLKPGVNSTIDSQPFCLKVERSTKFGFVVSRKPSSWPRTCWSLYSTASFASLDKI